jgi:HAE1 family hydrophobic/amphiphilic exporter-1
MDSDVTDVLEEEINTIEGVKNIVSASTEGQSQIIVEFNLSKDVDIAAQEVRDKVNIVQADLPRDLEPPIVQKIDIASQPIMWIAVTTSGDYRRAALYADEVLKERLQTVPGVGSVFMGGFRDREIRIWLKPRQLEARSLAPVDVASAIQSKHIELPGGRIEQPEQEFVVKVQGEYRSIEELKELVVSTRKGTVIRLKDVAFVEDGSEDLRSIARFNGLPTIGLGIRKQSGTNTVEVSDAVKATLAEIESTVPEGINVQLATDSSRFIRNTMNDVIFDLFLGALLTSLVILIFLRSYRMTLISVVAIPTSIIASFVLMYTFDFTINNMTMLAMSLSIGMVIDDAIVVLENIFRHVEGGQEGMEAARAGTSQVGFAVIATTLSVVAVFVPVAFMKGIIGRFFLQFGLSVAGAVMLSTLVALTLIPMLCSRFLTESPKQGRFFRRLESAFQLVESIYARLLELALRRRWATIGIAASVFVFGLMLSVFVPKGLVTEPDQSEFTVRFELPTGASVENVDRRLRELEKVVLEQPETKSLFAASGFTGASNSGILFVNLVYPHQREANQVEVMARFRRVLEKVAPDARIAVEYPSVVGGGQRNTDLQYIVKGPDVESLNRVAEQMVAEMRTVPGFVDVDHDLRLNKPEFKVDIDRGLADDLNVDVRNITQNFSILFGGQDVATFKEGGKRYDIRLRAIPDARLRLDDLLQVSLRSSNGELIKAANLIHVRQGTGPNSVNRFNRSRSVTLFANLEETSLGKGLDTIAGIARKHIPNDPTWSTALSGSSDIFEESFQYLLYALGVAIVMIYVILGSQFESFIHPFTILMSVPLAIAGSFGLMLITGVQLDIFSFIGFVMLTGIVTKNAILLVDFTNQMRRRGMSRDKALRRAGPLRLRPILMTAFTTIAAVTPIAMALSEGGEQRAPMGVTVIGGMLTATFLTLLVIPCVYTVMDDLGGWFARGLRLAGLGGRKTVEGLAD